MLHHVDYGGQCTDIIPTKGASRNTLVIVVVESTLLAVSSPRSLLVRTRGPARYIQGRSADSSPVYLRTFRHGQTATRRWEQGIRRANAGAFSDINIPVQAMLLVLGSSPAVTDGQCTGRKVETVGRKAGQKLATAGKRVLSLKTWTRMVANSGEC